MIARPAVRSIPTFLAPCLQQTSSTRCIRTMSSKSGTPVSQIPEPTPFIPDVATFLSVIGRNLSQHAPKIPTWRALFSLTSPQLKELGIDPPRSRRYLLRWRQKFREGQYGIGGDAKVVQDGVVPLRVVEIPIPGASTTNAEEISPENLSTATHTRGTRKLVVNMAHTESVDAATLSALPERLPRIKGVKIKGLHTIVGPHVLPVKGGEKGKLAQIVVKEGIWEDKRGKKIDGGERRRAEVRSKRRAEQRKTSRG